jgi:hypothetical protein
MEERIARVADSKLMPADLWPSVRGPMATRESRMEVVAWIAVCKFNCSLEGGFVRDWIVANERVRPPTTIQPSEWVKFDTITGTPSLLKELVPSDLDCKMPLNCYFDLEKFCDELKQFDMIPQIYRSRRSYRLLFDQYQSTGPFTLELIEPYSSVGFRIPDLDVNNLCIKRDQCNELSQRVDLSEPPCFLDRVQIVENIKKKKFNVLPSINELITNRINKMVTRGWTQIGSPLIDKPQQIKPKFVISALSTDLELYKNIENAIQQIAGITILSIEQIYNSELECIYESMANLIANECIDNNSNERFLFHGTHTDKGKRIMNEGFDYGFFKIHGRFGKIKIIHFKNILLNSFIPGNGAYFSDNPQKSHEYTLPTNDDDTTRIMFYTKVVLGQEMITTNVNNALCSPPRDYHSVRGVVSDTSEYIVYRLTQALPFVVITYRINSF